MKFPLLIFLCTLYLFPSCKVADQPQKNTDQLQPSKALGDTVQALGNSIMVIYQDQKEQYWFGSWETGLYQYDGKALIHFTAKHGFPFSRVDEIKEDQYGNLYFASSNPNVGIVKFDGNTFTTLNPVRRNDWRLAPSDIWFRHSFELDPKVYRYDGITLYELDFPSPPNLTNPFGIYSIYKDRKGNIWFGTNPVGVCRYDGRKFDWITEEDVTEFRDEGANGVRSIAEDKNGDFWFNTEARYSIYDRSEEKNDPFYTRHESIGGLDGKKDSNLDEYLSVVRDNQDNLWFVTYRDGVWKYDGEKITHYIVQDNGKAITLFSIYMDHRGDLWLGTHENGAFKFNGTTFEKFKP